jgi:hypothetical protein
MHDGPWDIVRNFHEFKDYINEHGIPNVISFDNDLGVDQHGCAVALEGRHCAEWLIERFLYFDLENDKYKLPDGFQFTVHSMNPIAAEQIKDHLDAAIEVYRER